MARKNYTTDLTELLLKCVAQQYAGVALQLAPGS